MVKILTSGINKVKEVHNNIMDRKLKSLSDRKKIYLIQPYILTDTNIHI